MPVCMGDDVDNSIFDIELHNNATLGDLMDVIRYGGYGNKWPITSGYKWEVYSNIGKIAKISPQTEHITYYYKTKDEKLSALSIQWVYAAREIDDVDIVKLENLFGDL